MAAGVLGRHECLRPHIRHSPASGLIAARGPSSRFSTSRQVGMPLDATELVEA